MLEDQGDEDYDEKHELEKFEKLFDKLMKENKLDKNLLLNKLK